MAAKRVSSRSSTRVGNAKEANGTPAPQAKKARPSKAVGKKASSAAVTPSARPTRLSTNGKAQPIASPKAKAAANGKTGKGRGRPAKSGLKLKELVKEKETKAVNEKEAASPPPAEFQIEVVLEKANVPVEMMEEAVAKKSPVVAPKKGRARKKAGAR